VVRGTDDHHHHPHAVRDLGAHGPRGLRGLDRPDRVTGAPGQDGADGQDGAPGQDGARQDGADGQDAPVDVFAVPSYGPESITAASDDTLYVTSIGDGSVVKVSPDRLTITTFLPAETAQPMGKTGMLIDEANDAFWTCAVGTDFATASELRQYRLSDGTLQQTLPMATSHAYGFCNDLALDASGNLYVTDSFVGIQRLPAGGSALEDWSTDPVFQPLYPGDFAIDGIAVDGDDVYVNNLEQGTLIRVPIDAYGAAGAPVVIAGVTMSAPDGMRLLAPATLIVTEGGGFGGSDAVTKVVVDPGTDTGVRTVLSTRIDRPSAVVVSQGDAWVTEGQIARVFGLDVDGSPPQLPFLVRRVELF
jgi:sugar lactone lactonase YvrE